MNRSPTLSLRALLGGMLLGALLTPCNIYSGLKIGWSFNVSILALLLASGFWALLARLSPARRPLGTDEGNLTQTTASASANIISGGLVAPIPALAMLTGENLSPLALIVWVFAVSFLGIWVAWYLRDSLVLRSALPFPTGRATAETLLEICERGREAHARLRVLLGATVVSGISKWIDTGAWQLPRPGFGFSLPASGAIGSFGMISAKNLTLTFDPSLMLAGFGAIIGWRAGVSLLLGALIAWLGLGPWGLAAGFITPGADDPDASWFAPMIEWLLWPGVSLMVAAALTQLALRLGTSAAASAGSVTPSARGDRWFRLAGLLITSVLVVSAEILIFAIPWTLALLAVPFAFVLAMVAARVVGETGIPPIGAIGKVSQLGTGMLAPGAMTANLIGANVAGGAAGQSADLLNDFKVGHLVGTPVRLQVIAQMCGILIGSVVGSLVYLALIPDPAHMLITPQWPAPAVATWKVVAETLSQGLGAVPLSARWAILGGVCAGIGLTLLEHWRQWRWLPSAPALGLAMVIPASLSITMFLGALIARGLERWRPSLARRFVIAAASGLIAGESLIGVTRALIGILQ